MDMRQLNYFISVAEHLNFTKAAEHHYIAQTAISQQIQALEQHLGVKLFLRNNRLVQLTPAGKVFYKEAKLMVARSEEAISKTRRAALGNEGTLKIGFQGPNEKRFLPALIRTFKHMYPNIDLSFIQNNPEKLREALAHGLLDLAFTSVLGLEQTPGVVWNTFSKDPICAIIYRDHPLANEKSIRRSSLANESFVAIDRREAPFARDAMIRDCVNCGFSPNIVAECLSFESLLLLVEAEVGIALMRRGLEAYANNSLRFIELEGENEYNELVIAWMEDNLNPTIPLFLQALENQLHPSTDN